MEFENCFFETDDYEITNKKLGEGSYGKVFVVKCQNHDFLYAAKIINTQGVFSSHDQMMFLRESFTLMKLDHPAIVKFYGINFHSFDNPNDLNPTILTEYYTNGSLKEILDKEKNSIADANWSPTKKYICLLGITDAMRYLHKAGIIHRDLKPQNILVDGNYYPRVCDFGLSRCFSNSLTNSMKMSMTGKIGTPLYMAPELLEDQDHYGPAIDVYAFAILAYEIVTGKDPFSEKGKSATLKTLLRKISTGGRPEFTEGVNDKMKDLISQCWSQDPNQRPSFESIFERLSTDFSFSDETVDDDEINEYLEVLEESRNSDAVPSSSLQDELDKLKEENRNCKEQINRIENEKKLMQTELLKLKEDSKEQVTKNETLQKELDKLKDEFKKLQAQLNNSDKYKKCLHIKIIEAQRIAKAGSSGKLNSFVSLRLKSQTYNDEYATKTIYKTGNPVWNEEFNIISNDKDDALVINMYNEESKKDEELMDQLEIPVSKWKIGDPNDRIVSETKLKKKKIGTLILEVQAFPPIGEHSNASSYMQKRKMKKSNKIILRFLLLGSTNRPGKSQLILRYHDNQYYENHLTTIGTYFQIRQIEINGQKITIQTWDSAGVDRSRNITRSYFKHMNAFMIVYDITNLNSLKEACSWYDDIKEFNLQDKVAIALVGNKVDKNEERKVPYEDAEKIATQNGWLFFETSAKENIGVDDAFEGLAAKALEYI